MQDLLIEYCDPTNHLDTVTLTYKLRNHSVADKWVERLQLAQATYAIDDPGRFYGFGTIREQTASALDQINQCIAVINDYQSIVNRSLATVDDQDTLNYLHSIFEQYHGLLDEQNTDYWQSAPTEVRSALANLNILVHRCESISRGAEPRHVVTWYGLPKTEVLELADYELFEPNIQFGTVYLNYVEIGKTFDDLAVDNDQYIGEDAFRPFQHYSADFNIKFWTTSDRQLEEHRAILNRYYDTNKEFFTARNLTMDHPYLRSGSIALADLVDDPSIVEKLATRQWVKSVTLI